MEMIAVLLFTSCCLVVISNAFPLAKRMVDMTYTFDETTPHFPGIPEFNVNVLMSGTYGYNRVQLMGYSSHIDLGTHMCAPSHIIKGGKNVDEIPVSEFIAPAAVIDISARAALDPDTGITVDDLLRWESTTGQSLNGTIVLMMSGWGSKWNDLNAFHGTHEEDRTKLHFPGMTREAAQWMVDNRNVKGIGSDTVSLDIGQSFPEFPSHNILLGHGIFGLEMVANVDKLPLYGAMLYVFPMKIGKGSGAPTRIVATISEIMYGPPTSNNEMLLSS